MGWGHEPHEGHAARRLANGTLTSTWTADTADFEAYVAACSCGWRGGAFEPTDMGEDAAAEEWESHHWRPLIAPPEHQRLVLGTNGGGRRHFLDGRPVHCGQVLELLLSGGAWVPVRYETCEGRALGYVVLGGPGEALDATDQVHFPLPTDAVLRWPG